MGPKLSSARRDGRGLRLWCVVVLVMLAFMLAGCGEKKRTRTTTPQPPTISDSTATAKRTPPPLPRDSDGDDEVKVDPNAKPIWTETGSASWYGPPYHNRRGANGEVFDTNAMTAAHKTLPMNSIVRVTNLKTEHSAIVRITDRGPFIGDRIIDLSMAAAKAVDVWRAGVAKVRVDVLEAPSAIEKGGRWCVQVGAFSKQHDAIKLKDKLARRYTKSKVLQFAGPTGYWVRVRVPDDDKKRAQEVANVVNVDEGGVFLVRLD